MKKKELVAIILLLMFSIGILSSVEQKLSEFQVVSDTDTETVIEFTLPDYTIDKMELNGSIYSIIESDTPAYTAEVGMPYLPMFGTGVAVSNTGKISYEVLESKFSEIKMQNEIYPTQETGLETSQNELVNNNYEGIYPEKESSIGEPAILRDFRMTPLVVTPFQYNEKRKSLKVCEYLKVRIYSDSSETGINEKKDSQSELSSALSSVYQANIINYTSRYSREMNLNANVLMIHKDNDNAQFANKLAQIVRYKKQKGFNVKSLSTADIGSTSSSGIKSYIQSLYDGTELINDEIFKPEYIIIIGDATGSFSIPTFNQSYANNAEGDYPYTLLEGNDFIGDAIIGRMSIQNVTDLARYYGKLKSYELLTNPDNDDFLGRMLLVGDTAHSGQSTINNCKYVQQISQAVYPDYDFVEMYTSGPSVSQMNQAMNEGVGIFNYRGYIGMSGWDPGSQNNVHKLIHAIIITCATGNFAGGGYGGGTSTTESFVNMGSEASPKGALSAIGMATSSTHTSYNNCLAGGIFEALITQGQRDIGSGLLGGKVYLNIVYGASELADVKKFSHWCNLIGDPTAEVFIGVPTYMQIETSQLLSDSDDIMIHLKDESGVAISNANVSITYPEGTIFNARTSDNGIAIFDLPAVPTMLQVTANKSGYHPLQQTVRSEENPNISINSIEINDVSGGNGDSIINPGETVQVNYIINNLTDTAITNLSATLSIPCTNVVVNSSESTISEIAANSSTTFSTAFEIAVNSDIPDETKLLSVLNCTYNDNQSAKIYKAVNISNGDIKIVSQSINMADNFLHANEHCDMNFQITNEGHVRLDGVYAKLVINNGFFNIVNDSLYVGDMSSLGNFDLAYDVFSSVNLFGGMTANCILKLSNDINFYQEIKFVSTFGTSVEGEPLGPEQFGYVIYDSDDTSHMECPEYEWIEIAPSNGGNGTELSVNDPNANSDEGDQPGSTPTQVVDLPFEFSYYGNNYDKITVCTNGYISFGENTNGEFRNYRLPGALGPNGMIAPFWDNLYTDSNSSVVTYYDQGNSAFIIQWEKMRNGCSTNHAEETFQLILYNPQTNPSTQGQGQAKIQYKTINNCDNYTGNYTPWHANYATVGIESPDGSMGLEYTYNNEYPTSCKELENEMALFITSKPIQVVEPLIVISNTNIFDENANNVVEPHETVNLGISLGNRAITPLENVNAVIHCSDPRVNVVQNSANYGTVNSTDEAWGDQFFTLELSDGFANGDTIALILQITGDGNYSFTRNTSVTVNVADYEFGEIVVSDFNEGGNNDGIPNLGENVQIGIEIKNNAEVDGTINSVSLNNNSLALIPAEITKENVIIAGKSTNLVVFDAMISDTAQSSQQINFTFSINTGSNSVTSAEKVIVIDQAGISYDFEGSNVMTDLETNWAVGQSSWAGSHSADNILGIRLSGNYPNNTNSIAWTDYFVCTSEAQLTFWQKYNTESYYDGGNIVAQIENAQNKTVLTPSPNYNQLNCSALGGPGFSGNNTNWHEVTVDMPNTYVGQRIRIGFRFASDGYQNGHGWFIDDLEISGLNGRYTYFDGNVSVIGNSDDVENIRIQIGDKYQVNPDDTGLYKIVLPRESYDVSYFAAGFTTDNTNISAQSSNNHQNYDAEVYWLNPATSLASNISNGNLTLSWNYEDDSDNALQSFIVQRQVGATPWSDLASVEPTNTNYGATLSAADFGHHSYRVIAHYNDGNSIPTNIVSFDYTTQNSDEDVIPVVTSMNKNYPNPFNPETTIAYSLKKDSKVVLKVYNIKGQLVKTLINGNKSAGNHTVVWHGNNNNNNNVASGVYFFKFDADDYHKTTKGVLMK